MSCLEHPIERPNFAEASDVDVARPKAEVEKLDAEAKAVAERLHFAKHYGEDFHGAIGDFFSLPRPEQEAFLQAFDNEVCSTTSASRIAKVLRDAAGIAA